MKMKELNLIELQHRLQERRVRRHQPGGDGMEKNGIKSLAESPEPRGLKRAGAILVGRPRDQVADPLQRLKIHARPLESRALHYL